MHTLLHTKAAQEDFSQNDEIISSQFFQISEYFFQNIEKTTVFWQLFVGKTISS
jgi:hypothetical protein